MIKRKIQDEIIKAALKMPVIAITGPRQSGKTTLSKLAFRGYDYVSLENPQLRSFAKEDPQGFLSQYTGGVILDEVQYVPELFSYIQLIVDEERENGRFILTGSQNFLLTEKINQSLAGRVAIYNLLPFSIEELKQAGYKITSYETYLLKGFYPRIYEENLDAGKWLSDYIRTYIERDVRQLINIGDLALFQNFLSLCAGRTGQIINHSVLANEIGVSSKTIQRWFSVLEASYIVFFLQPFHKNYNKRIIKSPKLYFYDTGLVTHLLKINAVEEIQLHFAKGALFENLIIAELKKKYWNRGKEAPFYYWRESNSNEVDLIIDKGIKQLAIEIKSGKTIREEFFKGVFYWQKLSETKTENSYLVYGGDLVQKRSQLKVINWNTLNEIETD